MAEDNADEDQSVEHRFPVVGIGASAGGLKALEAFFEAVPEGSKMAFVVVQHLAPDHESSLVSLLQRHTALEVEEAADQVVVQPGHVYVIPPDRTLTVEGEALSVEALDQHPSRETIDVLFRSLAEVYGEASVGVVLSGSGQDGTVGLRGIKDAGGLTLVQEPEEAEYDTMPRSAKATGIVDLVAPVATLASRLAELVEQGWPGGDVDTVLGEDGKEEPFEQILQWMRVETDIDFTEYKQSTLMRRIGRRIQVLGLEDVEAYAELLRDNPEEMEALENEVLIVVTRFFRDTEVWEAVEEEVIPSLFEGKSAGDQVRAWVPGCATGEEAYTVAMLLDDYANALASPPEIKVFGTDVHEGAIETARTGAYPKGIAEDVPAEFLEQYFYLEGGQYQVRKSLRERVLFAVQNALRDPPFSKLEMISCRNLLIYLQPEAQKRLLSTLHYGLKQGGVLILGNSESPNHSDGLFRAVDPSHHIYRARSASKPRLPLPRHGWQPGETTGGGLDFGGQGDGGADIEELHREAVLRRWEPPSVLVNDNWDVEHVIGDVSSFVKLKKGKPSRHLLDMVDVEMRPQLRSMLKSVYEGEPGVESVRFRRRRKPDVDVEAMRVTEPQTDEVFVEVSFRALDKGEGAEGSAPEKVFEEGEADAAVARLEKELEQLRARLRSTIEEYETSNEELLSMNEELQSTTEELESSKEELQSMNEELTTVNDELSAKVEELHEANSDLKNLLESTEIGTIFLDRELRIRRFSKPVQEYFNILEVDEGRPFEHVTHDLEIDGVEEMARQAIRTEEATEREVSGKDGRHFIARILPYRTVEGEIDGAVLTFVDITERKEAEMRLQENEAKLRAVVENAGDAIFVYRLDEQMRPGTFVEVNEKAVEMLGKPREAILERKINDVLSGDIVESHLEAVAREGWSVHEGEVAVDGERIPVAIHSSSFKMDGRPTVVDVVRDVTAQKRYEQVLEDAKQKAEELAELRSMFLSTLSHEVRSPLTAILSLAHLLKADLEEMPKQREYVERIERAGDKLRGTLDSVLEMARLEVGEYQPEGAAFEMRECLAEQLEMHQVKAEQKGLELHSHLPDAPVDVVLDAKFVDQIVNNLVDNAVKYTDEGEITVGLEADEERVRIRVSDTGMGIDPDKKKVIFEEFEQLGESGDLQRTGVGLGLAITKMLVESMDGSIDLESQVGEGTMFVVELPRELS